MNSRILIGDVLDRLAELTDESVQCIVTSPPYWGLRDYGTGTWEGGETCSHIADGGRKIPAVTHWNTGGVFDPEKRKVVQPAQVLGGICKCGARRIDLQLGLERTPEEYVEKMVVVFREVRRVLRSDGTLWLNMGDSYCSGNRGGFDRDRAGVSKNLGGTASDFHAAPNRMPLPGLKDKDLVGVPWRLAFALQTDGWWLRSDIIWAKPNPMPESVTDRPTKAHEYVFLLTKNARYFYDQEAVKEPGSMESEARYERGRSDTHKWADGGPGNQTIAKSFEHMRGKNERIGSVTPEERRGHARRHDGFNDRWDAMEKSDQCSRGRNLRSVWTIATQPFPEAHFATFPEELAERCIKAGSAQGDTVLDPFAGSGTTGAVAVGLQRDFIGIELNPVYAEMARRRIGQVAPLLLEVRL